jgi:hypothetical protein
MTRSLHLTVVVVAPTSGSKSFPLKNELNKLAAFVGGVL